MRIGSFFSGIGGLELGLERALGAETVFQCEQNPFCRDVLEHHWPGVQRHDDIETFQPEDIPETDIWCGGFPCQDISIAGRGVGLSGERSGLWWEWYRLIRVVRPRVVVVENVAAFLGRGLGEVLGALTECGFDAEWSTVSAADVGAPHLRRRVFVVAHLADADEEGPQGHRRLRERPGQCLARESRRPVPGAWLPEPDVGRVAHGVPRRVDRLRALGNAVVPQCAELVGHWIRDHLT